MGGEHLTLCVHVCSCMQVSVTTILTQSHGLELLLGGTRRAQENHAWWIRVVGLHLGTLGGKCLAHRVWLSSAHLDIMVDALKLLKYSELHACLPAGTHRNSVSPLIHIIPLLAASVFKHWAKRLTGTCK